MLESEFLGVLAAMLDPRDRRGRRNSSMVLLAVAVLAVAVLATAAGMRRNAGFATWARTSSEEVLRAPGIGDLVVASAAV